MTTADNSKKLSAACANILRLPVITPAAILMISNPVTTLKEILTARMLLVSMLAFSFRDSQISGLSGEASPFLFLPGYQQLRRKEGRSKNAGNGAYHQNENEVLNSRTNE